MGLNSNKCARRTAIAGACRDSTRPGAQEAAGLLGAHHTQHHRADRLQVTGVGCDADADLLLLAALLAQHPAK